MNQKVFEKEIIEYKSISEGLVEPSLYENIQDFVKRIQKFACSKRSIQLYYNKDLTECIVVYK